MPPAQGEHKGEMVFARACAKFQFCGDVPRNGRISSHGPLDVGKSAGPRGQHGGHWKERGGWQFQSEVKMKVENSTSSASGFFMVGHSHP